MWDSSGNTGLKVCLEEIKREQCSAALDGQWSFSRSRTSQGKFPEVDKSEREACQAGKCFHWVPPLTVQVDLDQRVQETV